MADQLNGDVIVSGVGIAGTAAAIAAARTGASTVLIGCEGAVGGDACTGMPVLGAFSSRGVKCVGGVLDEAIEICKGVPGGYIGPVCDYRTVYGICVNPEAMRAALLILLKRYGVRLFLNSTVVGVESSGGRVDSIRAVFKDGATRMLKCKALVDATGDGVVVRMAGGDVLHGGENGEMQPASLVFRMAGVGFEKLLRFIKENPAEALLAENPVMERNPAKAAAALYAKGLPYVALSAKGALLGAAIGSGRLHPCTAMFITPVSQRTGEVCVNATRIANLDATDTGKSSEALLDLTAQMLDSVRLLTAEVPGFESAVLSSVAPRLGVRETGRIVGDMMLTQDEVVAGAKSLDGIGRGAHHVDIHGAGTAQTRIPVADGGVYDIPFGCLLPRKLKNVAAAGRCISSDRGANGSARVMGTCMTTGHAAGAAAALAAMRGLEDIRETGVPALRRTLAAQGAILED